MESPSGNLFFKTPTQSIVSLKIYDIEILWNQLERAWFSGKKLFSLEMSMEKKNKRQSSIACLRFFSIRNFTSLISVNEIYT
jgi:hypothetical protein